MSDKQAVLNNIVNQWGTFLSARILFATGNTIEILQQKVSKIAKSSPRELGDLLRKAYDLVKSLDIQQVRKMSLGVDRIIQEFAPTDNFPSIFQQIMGFTYDLMTIPFNQDSPQGKTKALHTEVLVKEEELTELELLSCEVFIYISSIIQTASKANVNFDNIPKELMAKIFVFLDHDQPNAVRASAGEIIAALSVSPHLLKEISEIFWAKFFKCRKDDEFRNFASWIDGVKKIQLSLTTPESADSSIDFLSKFVSAAPKKIERGVLRMQFLQALDQILTRLNNELSSKDLSGSLNKATQYNETTNEIWNIVMKWSSKGKHTLFCYQFLISFLGTAPLPFFLAHAPHFIEQIIKFCSKSSGEPESLQLIVSFIRNSPPDYYQKRAEDFSALLNLWVVPLLFPGLDKQKPQIKFDTPEQINVIVAILVEIGKKALPVSIDIFRITLSLTNPNPSPLARLVSVQALAQICEAIPESMKPHNVALFPLLEAILLSQPPSQPEEIQYALHTFPIIHSENSIKLAQISQILFDFTLSNNNSVSASEALSRFISTLVSLTDNPLPPVNYMSHLLDSPTPSHLQFFISLINSFSTAMNQEDFSLVSDNKSPLSVSDWQTFRSKVDSTLLPHLISGGELSDLSKQILIAFRAPSLNSLDKACHLDFTLSSLFSDDIDKTKFTINPNDIITSSSELGQKLFGTTLEFWRSNQTKLDPSQSQKFIVFLCGLARDTSSDVSRFFEEFFQLLRNTEQPTALAAIHMTEWVEFITELNQWMVTTGLTPFTFWPQYVSVHHAFAMKPEFSEQLKYDSKLAECYERFLIGFYKKLTPPSKNSEFAVAEKCFRVLSVYAKVCGVERLVDSPPSFITSMESLVPLDRISEFTKTYMETFLRTLQAIFLRFDIMSLNQPNSTTQHDPVQFLHWLSLSLSKLRDNEQVVIQGSTLLTLLLLKDPSLLSSYLYNSFTSPVEFILSTANAYGFKSNDFGKEDMNPIFSSITSEMLQHIDGDFGSSVLAMSILHVYDEDKEARQACYKLICELLKRPELFEKTVSVNQALMLAAQTAFGYEAQGDQFIQFVTEAAGPQLTLDVIQKLADYIGEIKGEQSQCGVVDAMSLLFERAVHTPDLELNSIFNVLLSTTMECRSGATVSVINLWEHAWKSISDRDEKDIKSVLQFVFEWGTSPARKDRTGIITATTGIVAASTPFPAMVSELLLNVISKFDKKLPENLSEFSEFLKNANLEFEASPENILAYTSLSQIFLLIPSKTDFMSLYASKLPLIMFFAIMMHSRDEFIIPPYHPLLDSLVDTALFRFADSGLSEKLLAVQSAGLLRRSSSLEPQYSIVLEEQSRAIISYDHAAVSLLLHLFNELDPEFTSKFITTALAAGFLTNPESQYAPGAFIMLTSLAPEVSSRNIFFMLLYGVHVFLLKREALIDALFDNVQMRIEAKILPDEALPTLIVLTLYLRLDLKRAQTVHLVHVLSGAANRVLRSSARREISTGLADFLKKFHSDEFIVSSLLPLLQSSTSLKDTAVSAAAEALSAMAQLLEPQEPLTEEAKKFDLLKAHAEELPKNGCSMIVLMLEYISRMTIGEEKDQKGELSLKFAEELIKFNPEHLQLAMRLLAGWRTLFKCNDVGINDSVLDMLSAVLRSEGKDTVEGFETEEVERIGKALVLASVGAEEGTRRRAAAALVGLLKKSELPMQSYRLSVLSPKLVAGITEIEAMPHFKLFAFDGVDERDLVMILEQTITAMLTKGNDEVVPKDLL